MKLILIIVLMSVVLFAADPGEDLQVASRRGQLAEVKKLVNADAPLEGKNQYGATPLYMAVLMGIRKWRCSCWTKARIRT